MALSERKTYSINEEKLFFEYSKITLDKACRFTEDETVRFFNVVLLCKASANYTIDFKPVFLEGNILLFLSPGELFTVNSEKVLEGYSISFDTNFYCLDTHHEEIGCNGLLFNNQLRPSFAIISDEEAKALIGLLQEIESNIQQKHLAYIEIIQSYLKIFLIKCSQIKKHQYNIDFDGRQIDPLLVEFNRLVEKNYRHRHYVADYADLLGISSKSLTKKLNLHGKKPSDLIQNRLILEAKRLLFHSDMTSKEISYFLGFEDPSYFSRFFKKHTNLSPSRFKEQSHYHH